MNRIIDLEATRLTLHHLQTMISHRVLLALRNRDERERCVAALQTALDLLEWEGVAVARLVDGMSAYTATKEQEKKTLAAIRKMVDALGPQSYIATAFAGAFEDAEANIENDFGNSMKGRWELAEAKLAAAKIQIEKLKCQKRRLQEAVNRLRQEDLDRLQKKNERLTLQMSRMKFAANSYYGTYRPIVDDAISSDDEVKEAVQRMIENAGQLNSEMFQAAALDYQRAQDTLARSLSLLRMLRPDFGRDDT